MEALEYVLYEEFQCTFFRHGKKMLSNCGDGSRGAMRFHIVSFRLAFLNAMFYM